MQPRERGNSSWGCAGRGTLPSGTVAGLGLGHLAAWAGFNGVPGSPQRTVQLTSAGRYSITVGEAPEGPLVPQEGEQFKAASSRTIKRRLKRKAQRMRELQGELPALEQRLRFLERRMTEKVHPRTNVTSDF